MSKQCQLQEKPLRKLDGSYLETTKKKGVLRVLQESENIELRAQGFWFYCPTCEGDKAHGITILFEGVDPELAPKGRYSAEVVWPMERMTVINKIKPADVGDCKWSGWISQGKVKWK